MMPVLRKPLKINYQDRLLVCFLIGLIAGTVLVNLLSQEVRSQAGYFGSYFTAGFKNGSQAKKELLWVVCRQRIFETGIAWLVGLTVFAVPCFYGMAAYYGLSAGMILSLTTCQKGLMGLPCYLATLLPHFLIYIPVWIILAVWAGDRTSKIRILPMIGLILLTSLGAFLEAYINPYFLQILL